jgi:hypothetical protein
MRKMVLILLVVFIGCGEGREETNERLMYEHGGGETVYKIPLPQGYNWEVTQSWSSHCGMCDSKYPSNESFCASSHVGSCCKYAWDFNLPGDADSGKPVLSSADGIVYSSGYSSSWGNTVVIDHGEICTRYAHLNSLAVHKGEEVCQGQILGEIGDTGISDGSHLHFHFEECGTHKSVEMNFTDGNGVPVCTVGDDVLKEKKYDFLEMTNESVEECTYGPDNFSDASLPYGGWSVAECGSLPECPMIPNCNRPSGHVFEDEYDFDYGVGAASAYLYSECAIDGYPDGSLRPRNEVNRAEVLKVALSLFGLSAQCGGSLSFLDVSEDDWYFPYVACAVKHGIIDNTNSYFGAGETATLAEASKILVLSAVRAGVIDISESSEDVFWQISPNHWAHKYLMTLYLYGGLPSPMPKYDADHRLLRRALIVMAASLSPCFCKNVICRNGCACHQSSFSCINPYDQSSGTGGLSELDPEDQASESSHSSYKTFDLDIDCYVKSENTRCEDEGTVLYIKCSIVNSGHDEVKINDLVLSIEDVPSGCALTDSHLKSGESVTNVDPGEEKSLTGHFEVACSHMPQEKDLEVLFDLIEKIAGVKTLYEDLLETSFEIPEAPFLQCNSGVEPEDPSSSPSDEPPSSTPNDNPNDQTSPDQTQENTWECDPTVGYRLDMSSIGGKFQTLDTSDGFDPGASFPPGGDMSIYFVCSDLPAAILVETGQGLTVLTRDYEAAFEVWAPYFGNITLNAAIPPDEVNTVFSFPQSGSKVLIRFPVGM